MTSMMLLIVIKMMLGSGENHETDGTSDSADSYTVLILMPGFVRVYPLTLKIRGTSSDDNTNHGLGSGSADAYDTVCMLTEASDSRPHGLVVMITAPTMTLMTTMFTIVLMTTMDIGK